jgi:hypothetical protein
MRWTSLRDRFDRIFFAPRLAVDLGLHRAIFFALCVWVYSGRDYSGWGQLSAAFWQPKEPWTFIHFYRPTPDEILIAQKVWVVTLATSALGFLTRVSTWIAAILGYLILSFAHSHGFYHHRDGVLVSIMFILALSRAGDAFSIDDLIRSAREKNFQGLRQMKFPEAWRWPKLRERMCVTDVRYAWPIQCVRVVWTLVFFSAALSKLKASGLDWVLTDNLRNIFLTNQYLYQDWARETFRWGIAATLAARPLLCKFLAAFGLGIELIAPLALKNWRWRIAVVGLVAGMQIGIYLTVLVNFKEYVPVYVWWIGWSSLWAYGVTRTRRARVAHKATASKS